MKRMLKEYVDERSKLLAGTACPPSQDDIRSDRVPKLISSSLNLSADDMWSRAVDIANMAHGEHRSILGDVTDKSQPSVLCTDKSLESVLIGRNQGKKDLVVERRDDVVDKEKRIREENIDLKKEIDALRARHLHDRHREEIKTKAELKDSKIEATVSYAFHSLHGQQC